MALRSVIYAATSRRMTGDARARRGGWPSCEPSSFQSLRIGDSFPQDAWGGWLGHLKLELTRA